MTSIDDLLDAIQPILPGLVTAGIFLLALIVLRVLLRRESVATKLRFPTALFFFYLGLFVLMVLAQLYWPPAYGVLHVLGLFVLALAVILAVSVAAFDLVMGRYRQVQVPKILRDIVVLIVFSVAVIAVLGRQGVDLTSILTTSAVLTAVIGFALQDMLSNIISGLALQIERPFVTGDWVKFDEQEGWILEINWRSTQLQTLHNDIVIIPNNLITRSAVINFTSPTRVHRRKLTLGLRYETPPNEAKASILRAVRGVEGVLEDPAPFVLTRSYDDFSIAYRIHFYLEDFPRKERIEDEVLTRISVPAQARRPERPLPHPRHQRAPDLRGGPGARADRRGRADRCGAAAGPLLRGARPGRERGAGVAGPPGGLRRRRGGGPPGRGGRLFLHHRRRGGGGPGRDAPARGDRAGPRRLLRRDVVDDRRGAHGHGGGAG